MIGFEIILMIVIVRDSTGAMAIGVMLATAIMLGII
jgi:hypothetical protein